MPSRPPVPAAEERHGRMNRITRRSALRRLAAGAAGLAAGQRFAAAAAGTRPAATVPAAGPILVEKQSTGSQIWQVTSEPFNQSNIYCEVPYCSRDGRYFIYERTDPNLEPNPCEFMVVELGSFKQHRLDAAIGRRGCAITHDGVFYYLKRIDADTCDILRADLPVGAPKAVHRFRGTRNLSSLGTVSADHRYWAVGIPIDGEKDLYGILLVDLERGTEAIIDRDPYIFNAHPQFNPGDGRQLMIQHNRGGWRQAEGRPARTVGPEGATLYLLSVPDGRRTMLQVGKPYTTPITGHEAWAGTTDRIVLSVAPGGDYSIERGNLLVVRAGQKARTLAGGYFFNHVGVSRCGRLFTGDDWRPPYKIVIGSVATGRTAVVCESRTSGGRPQNTHPHAYLTPDFKWVIFNSDRGGFAHVHAASVPAGVVEDLLRT